MKSYRNDYIKNIIYNQDSFNFRIRDMKKKVRIELSFFNKTGSDLLSRAVSRQVSSAQESLTAVFGMGTGVAFPL